MNINNEPLRRPESQRPPTAAERASMEATRKHVQRANVEAKRVIQERTEATHTESKRREDRIEISVRAHRSNEAKESSSSRQDKIAQLRELHGSGNLNSPERTRAAAEKLLKRLNQA